MLIALLVLALSDDLPDADQLLQDFQALQTRLTGISSNFNDLNAKIGTASEATASAQTALAARSARARSDLNERNRAIDNALGKIDATVTAEVSKYARDGDPIVLSLNSAKTPKIDISVPLYDSLRFALARNWKVPDIPKPSGSSKWLFEGDSGEFTFRASEISKGLKVIVTPEDGVEKLWIGFYLGDQLTFHRSAVNLRASQPLVILPEQTIWFRDVKLVLTGKPQVKKIAVSDLLVYDAPVVKLPQ
jgi:hypothetical protein